MLKSSPTAIDYAPYWWEHCQALGIFDISREKHIYSKATDTRTAIVNYRVATKKVYWSKKQPKVAKSFVKGAHCLSTRNLLFSLISGGRGCRQVAEKGMLMVRWRWMEKGGGRYWKFVVLKGWKLRGTN